MERVKQRMMSDKKIKPKKKAGKRAAARASSKRASKRKVGRYPRSAVRLTQRAAKMRMARRAKASKKRPVRDELLERFDSGKSIADYIDFSAGRFVKIS